MKTYKNKQNENKGIMVTIRNIGLMFLLTILCMVSVNAQATHELLNWQFEEAGGSIVFDSTGNQQNGLLSGGATFSNSIKKWGDYSINFDGNNDLITTMTNSNTPDILTISFWYYDTSNGNAKYYFFDIDDTTEEHELEYDGTTDKLEYGYINNALVYTHQDIQTIILPRNIWRHAIITIDNTNDKLFYWRDGVNIANNVSITGGVNKDTTLKSLKVGANHQASVFFKGYIDSFRIFDGKLNSTQIQELYLSNTITLAPETPPEEENGGGVIGDIVLSDFITDYNPKINASITQDINFNVLLNHSATCELYIDYKITSIEKNIQAFSYNKFFSDENTHQWFVYCYYLINNTKYVDYTPYINFTPYKEPRSVEFFLLNEQTNDLFLGENLYLTTPCLKNDYSGYPTDLNQETPKYIKKINNGIATFNLKYVSQYDFCLVRGQINTLDNNFTTDFDIVEVNKQLDLGTISVKNDTYTYSFKIADTDLYKPIEPSFWSQTWASLFQLIIGVILGGLVIVIGLAVKSDKVVVAGVLVILAGMGVSITSFIGGILF